MNNIDDFNPENVLKDLERNQQAVNPATNELRLKLNEIIAKYHINPAVTPSVLGKLSAGYVHQMQQLYNDPSWKDIAEDMYQNAFKAYLAYFDAYEIRQEAERMRQKEMN